MRAVFTGTSIAVLTYLGFDGISTLSEEAENPRRNILLATVLVCLITSVLATIGSGVAAHLAAARLLYGMGRDDAIPKSFFGAIEPRRGIPRNNVIFVAV